jgi:hypothetical protein
LDFAAKIDLNITYQGKMVVYYRQLNNINKSQITMTMEGPQRQNFSTKIKDIKKRRLK